MAILNTRNASVSEPLVVGDLVLQLDRDGNLENTGDWSEQVAVALAQQAGISLSAEHWEILQLVREFHQRRGLSPVMRILVKLVENAYGPDKGNSLYLLRLFPGSSARVACRIAGLPRPSNCL